MLEIESSESGLSSSSIVSEKKGKKRLTEIEKAKERLKMKSSANSYSISAFRFSKLQFL